MAGRPDRGRHLVVALGAASAALILSGAPAALADTPAPAAPTLTLVSSQNPAPSGAAPKFMLALRPAPSCGSVTWLIDGAAPAAGVPTAGSGGDYVLGPVAGLAVGSHTVTAAYSGCETALATSGSVTETITAASNVPPTITAQVTSAAPKHHGWYRTPVHVAFSCFPGSSPLAVDCPDPVVLSKSGYDQSVTASVRDSSGRTGKVKVSVDIDRVAPAIRVGGAANGATYRHQRHLVCHASYDLSGVGSCKIRTTSHTRGATTTVRWTATAKDLAGNVRTKSGYYRHG